MITAANANWRIITRSHGRHFRVGVNRTYESADRSSDGSAPYADAATAPEFIPFRGDHADRCRGALRGTPTEGGRVPARGCRPRLLHAAWWRRAGRARPPRRLRPRPAGHLGRAGRDDVRRARPAQHPHLVAAAATHRGPR